MRFYSKVSLLLVAIVTVAFAPFLSIFFKDIALESKPVSFGLLIVIYGFVMHMFYNTHYTIRDNMLQVQSGFIKYRAIDIKTIKSVEPQETFSPLLPLHLIESKYDMGNGV